jgi:hypothetical protein
MLRCCSVARGFWHSCALVISLDAPRLLPSLRSQPEGAIGCRPSELPGNSGQENQPSDNQKWNPNPELVTSYETVAAGPWLDELRLIDNPHAIKPTMPRKRTINQSNRTGKEALQINHTARSEDITFWQKSVGRTFLQTSPLVLAGATHAHLYRHRR